MLKAIEGFVVVPFVNETVGTMKVGIPQDMRMNKKTDAAINIIIDKRKFIDHTPVDRIGYTKLRIELYKGVVGVVTVHVKEKAK